VRLTEKLSEEANRVTDRYRVVPIRTPYYSHSSKRGYWLYPKMIVLRIAAKSLQLAAWLIWQPIGTYQRPIQRYHWPSTDTCFFSKIGVLTSKICMAHYGQTVSAEWLLLTGYRHLPMPYLMPPFPTLPFPTKQGYLLLSQILGLRIAAKPLPEMAAWSLLTAYRNLQTPYPTVQSLTPTDTW